VLATETNVTLLAAVLPPGVAWTLNATAVIPFSLPRVRIRWRLWAWLASLPGWVVPVSAAAGSLLLLALFVFVYRRYRASREVAPAADAVAPTAAAVAPAAVAVAAAAELVAAAAELASNEMEGS